MLYWQSCRKDEGFLVFVFYLNTPGLPSNQTKSTKQKHKPTTESRNKQTQKWAKTFKPPVLVKTSAEYFEGDFFCPSDM